LLLYGVALDVVEGRAIPQFESDDEARAWQQQTGRPLYILTTDGATVTAVRREGGER
jgi:hypothetical protein